MAKKKAKAGALLDMMGEHAANVQVGATDEGLALISGLAQAQYDAALKVAECEDELNEARNELKKISEVDLPEAMKQCGVKEFTTSDNLVIKLKEDVNVGISVSNKEAAYKWLVDHEFGGLIKSELDIKFGREQLEDAEELAEELREKGYDIDLSQNIHYQTLKAFVKERMADTESGVEFPLDLFGARPYQVAVVKPRK